ncbi:MAG: efflux RND transporter permease subunit [Myxococcota bacterium]|nr:efflux RND transporter permease subunit [Myxococcota bacterium]
MIAWFARNHVAANLLMGSIIAAGLITLPTIKQTVFPDFVINYVSVTVIYPGASPVDIEKSVTVRIEEELSDVEGIEEMRSSANEGATNVLIELEDSADISKALDEIETRVNSIDTFPEEIERPIVSQILFRSEVLDVAIHGDVGERNLKEFGQQIRDEIAALPGVSQVDLVGVRPYEISLDVSEAALQRYGLRFDDVVMAVRRSSIDLPGGSVKTESGEILLRTDGQAYYGDEFSRIPLLTRADGARVTVGDVAVVRDDFEESSMFSTFDGEPAVFVQVYRVGEQHALGVASQALAYLAAKQASLPEGLSVTIWDDDSKYLSDRIDMMLRNAASGFVLVVVMLAIFLKLRVALWVAVGVPVAVAGGIALMPWLGIDINILSVFAFIMALGILVDDAIVTGENIYSHMEKTPDDPMGASIRGAQEVATPVIFGVLTTIAAFLPFGLVGGSAVVMAVSIGGVMMGSLIFSLVESKLVLPAHLGNTKDMNRPPSHWISIRWGRFQKGVSRRLKHFVAEYYLPAIRNCIEWRYLTLAVSLGIFVVAIGVVRTGHVKSSMSPTMERDSVTASLRMPLGTPVSETEAAVGEIQAALERLRAELDAERPEDEPVRMTHQMTMVGTQRSFGPDERRSSTGQSHLGQVTVRLSPSEVRSVTAPEIAQRWRAATPTNAGAEELKFEGKFSHFGDAIDIELRGEDLAGLRSATAAVQERLERYAGVKDIRDSYVEGKQELQLAIRPSAEALGLSLQDLGGQVRQAFYGAEAQRIQRGRDEVKVMVRYPAAERASLADVENMRIRLPDGTAVPFGAVAEATLARGPASIYRIDRKRRLRVTAGIDEETANAKEIAAKLRSDVMPEVLAAHPDISWRFRGEQQESEEAMAGLWLGFKVGLTLIFVLLAIPLRSYAQAIVIMIAIPFGYVGAVLGHWIAGEQMSFLSMTGVLACAGVVVNDSLVLVTFMNRLREQGRTALEAAIEAGQARFRAILLTSMTTFVGLVPVMLERTSQAQFVLPMALSLAFGVLVATGFTLLLIPSAMMIVEDLRDIGARVRAIYTNPSEPIAER